MPSATLPAAAIGLHASRRPILRGLAALPLPGPPALATAATAEPDPVLALIKAHKAALAATEAAAGEDIDAAARIDIDLMHELAETVPQTVARLRAMILHFAEIQTSTGDSYDVGVAFPAIAVAMAALFPIGGAA